MSIGLQQVRSRGYHGINGIVTFSSTDSHGTGNPGPTVDGRLCCLTLWGKRHVGSNVLRNHLMLQPSAEEVKAEVVQPPGDTDAQPVVQSEYEVTVRVLELEKVVCEGF